MVNRLQEHFLKRAALRPQVTDLRARGSGQLPKHALRLPGGQLHQKARILRLHRAAGFAQPVGKSLRVRFGARPVSPLNGY